MRNRTLRPHLGRRSAIALGAGMTGSLVASSTGARADPSLTQFPVNQLEEEVANLLTKFDQEGGGTLPVAQIQHIVQAQGTVSNGVLSIELDRNDLQVTGPGGIPFKPAWEINNELYFQMLTESVGALNADVCVLPKESTAVIEQIVSNGLVFQAFHQHFFGLSPMVFFIHFRGIGDPLALARAASNVVKATGTPLPQTMPSNPQTPLDSAALAQILGGSAQVGGSGVVTVSIPRRENIILGGVPVKSDLGILTTVAFEPLGGGQTAVAPDFALTAPEVNPVVSLMQKQGFVVHCLYNQETAELPQFYFSHQLAVGNASDLARKVRGALNLTKSKFMS